MGNTDEYRGVEIHENLNIPQGFYGRFYIIVGEEKHPWMGPLKERCASKREARNFIDKNHPWLSSKT